MKYFDTVKDIITMYSGIKIKDLIECPNTVAELKKEMKNIKKEEERGKKITNEYIMLAKKFEIYESGKDNDDGTGDWCFYKFLKETMRDNKYRYLLSNQQYVEAEINAFAPFYNEELINPQWHLLISSYAYIDAAFNHFDNTYASKIIERNNWTKRKKIMRIFPNKSLTMWMNEVKK